MRIVGTIPHPKVGISVFYMNDKFIVRFEAGGMEQAFRFSTEEVKGMDDIRERLDEAFLAGVIRRFNEMFLEHRRIQKNA